MDDLSSLIPGGSPIRTRGRRAPGAIAPVARRRIFGLTLSSAPWESVLDLLVADVPRDMPSRLIATLNLDHVVRLRGDEAFRRAYRRAWLITADGAPIYAYARMRGLAVPDRITGADLIEALAGRLDPARHRLLFVLSTDEVAERARIVFAGRGFGGDGFGCIVPRQDFLSGEAESRTLADRVRDWRPTHLILGVDARQAKIWIDRYGRDFRGSYILCVGSAVEFHLGVKPRAPAWMGRLGLEWAWRLATEPRRLYRRYVVSSWGIIPAVLADLRSRGGR